MTRTDIGGRLVALLPRLRRFAYGLSAQRETADDLVQIACERALARSESWQQGTNFDAWIFTILRNAWYDRLRRRRTEGISEALEDHENLSGPAHQSEERLTLEAVVKAMAQLSEEQREVLVLTCIEEFSYRQVSEMLGIPIGTVMSRLARARGRLADLVGITVPPKR